MRRGRPLHELAPVAIGRWASEGESPYAMTLGGRRRFRRNDVLEVIDDARTSRHYALLPSAVVSSDGRRIAGTIGRSMTRTPH